MSLYLPKENYSIETTSDNCGVVVSLNIYGEGVYKGEAVYNPGDTFNRNFAEKLARSKAWRAYWLSRAKEAMAASREQETYMNQLIDDGCSSMKKAKELDAYIEKLVKS